MTKRSPSEVWAALEESALDDEMEAVLEMSPEERRRELHEAGFDLEKVHAQADALGAEPVRPEPVAVLRPKRSRRAVVAAAVIALAAGIALVVRSALEPTPVAAHHPDQAPAAARARDLRAEARDDCAAKSWATCLEKLDEARALDPDGDESPEVQSLRRAAGSP